MKRAISLLLALILCTVTEVAKADFTFGTPTIVPNVNSSSRDYNPCISADGLSFYFISTRPGGVGGTDIWVTTRETTDDSWGIPVNLGPTINSPVGDGDVSISSDGLSLYFSSMRPGGYGDGDLWVTTRETIYNEWGTPMNLGPTLNSPSDQSYPSISADGLALYFTSNRGGGIGAYDLWVTRRETTEDTWDTPVNLGPTVNSSAYEVDPGISADGRTLFFASDRSGGSGDDDIWVTRRATADDDWGEPVNLGPIVNSSAWEDYPSVSADGSILFFVPSQFDRWNGGDIWQAPILPIVDFNADGIVDAADICIMVDSWGTDEPLCDIGPMPWGDGIVDTQDLTVLAECIGEPVDDSTLVGHWPLDETEGIVAHDDAGVNNGTILGLPQWRPQDGIISGALELNGTTFVTAKSALSPADGPFSVLAWVKGGGPGQSVVSQGGSVNWLMADAASGTLMTELSRGGRVGDGLSSQAIITDGNWHRIAFSWDGVRRRLYGDGVLVADDTQDSLAGSSANLIIGAAKSMAPGTFWYGLIDDVRVYNRAIVP